MTLFSLTHKVDLSILPLRKSNVLSLYLNFSASLLSSVADKIDRKFHTIEVEEGTTARELLINLKVPAEDAMFILLNGVETKSDQILKDGDRLGVLPAVSGG